MKLWQVVVVFLFAAVVDSLWTCYTLAATTHQPLAAASYSALIFIVGAFVTLTYLRDRRYLVFAAAGGFVGTYCAVRFG